MFPRLQRACFHPPSKLGGIQQAFFIKFVLSGVELHKASSLLVRFGSSQADFTMFGGGLE
jgi:hypothetical protein